MDRALYVAMNGASRAMQAQSLISHNIANASTAGFKAALAGARPADVAGPGLPSRVHTEPDGAGFDGSLGRVRTTGRDLDVALYAGGWLGVLGSDGETAYTRAGDLQINELGQLTTSSGQPVLGDGGPIAIPPAQSISIGGDGSVSIVPLGLANGASVDVDRLNVVNIANEDMQRGPDGLFRPRAEAEAEPAPGTVLLSGALEESNVSVATALVQMIEQQRRFETQVDLMQRADDNARRTAELMRLR